MEISFTGKRALVTGAGKGIGRAIAKALWEGGATVVAFSRTQSDLDSLEAECPGIKTTCVELGDWDAAQSAADSAGEIDLLVNNAGIMTLGPISEVTRASYDAVFDINVAGMLSVSQVVTRGMVQRKSGAVVNICGGWASNGTGPILVSAGGGARDQITRCMAVELGPHNIRVNSVDPGLVSETRMGKFVGNKFGEKVLEAYRHRIPLQRFVKVEDVVHAVLYLLSDKADMINGAFLPLHGGFQCT